MLTAGEALRPRWNQIEGLRAIAATLVFAAHAWGVMGGPAQRLVDAFGKSAVQTVSPFFFHAGSTGVSLFYAISGFLLYTPFVRARGREESVNLRSYLMRRAARIIPAYWLALIVIGVVTGNDSLFTPRGILDYFFFFEIWSTLDLNHLIHPIVNDPFNISHHLQFDVISGNPVGVAWTLCVEVTFYLFLPVWAWAIERLTAGRRSPLKIETLLLGSVMLASLVYKVIVLTRVVDIDFEPWLMILPNSIDIFAAGMLLALFSARSVKSGWPSPLRALGGRPVLCWGLAAALYGSVCLAEQSLLPTDLDQFLHWATGLWGEVNLLLAFLLLAPAVIAEGKSSAVSRLLNARPVAWIGLVSYGLYLWHVFVLEKVASLFEDGLVPLQLAPVMSVVAYVLSLAVAAASWYLMERKVLAWAHGRELLRRGRVTSG